MRRRVSLGDRLRLYSHGFALLRGKVLRWRLETYGLYMPSLPHTRPWWRVNARALYLLVLRRNAYSRWLDEMNTVRAGGGHAWWQRRVGHSYSTLDAYIQHENGADAGMGEDCDRGVSG